ncbi:hypothetical protein GCM10010304_07570 [Streptomyces roseoviolaceus]
MAAILPCLPRGWRLASCPDDLDGGEAISQPNQPDSTEFRRPPRRRLGQWRGLAGRYDKTEPSALLKSA